MADYVRGIQHRTERARAATAHKNRVGLLEIGVDPFKRRAGVDKATMVDIERFPGVGRVGDHSIAGVDVAGAVGDKEHGVIVEGVGGVVEIKDAADGKIGVVVIRDLAFVIFRLAARFGIGAAAAALEIDE